MLKSQTVLTSVLVLLCLTAALLLDVDNLRFFSAWESRFEYLMTSYGFACIRFLPPRPADAADAAAYLFCVGLFLHTARFSLFSAVSSFRWPLPSPRCRAFLPGSGFLRLDLP